MRGVVRIASDPTITVNAVSWNLATAAITRDGLPIGPADVQVGEVGVVTIVGSVNAGSGEGRKHCPSNHRSRRCGWRVYQSPRCARLAAWPDLHSRTNHRRAAPDTQFAADISGGLAGLTPGDVLRVSAQTLSNGFAEATRIERAASGRRAGSCDRHRLDAGNGTTAIPDQQLGGELCGRCAHRFSGRRAERGRHRSNQRSARRWRDIHCHARVVSDKRPVGPAWNSGAGLRLHHALCVG